jgi:hypothetical protein
MAVVWGRITFERSAKLDERQVREYTLVARVRTDSVNDGPGTILAAMIANGIDIGEPYQEPNGYLDLGARCKSIEPRVDQDDPMLWAVTCQYTSERPERTSSGERGYKPSKGQRGAPRRRPRKPTERPGEYRWTFERYRKVIFEAPFVDDATDEILDTRAVRNSAGFAFDPPPEIDDSRPVLIVTLNEEGYEPVGAALLGDKVNSDVFWGFPPGTAKLAPPEAEQVFEDEEDFWRVTYKVEFRLAAPYWDIAPLDQGYHALDVAASEGVGEAYRIVDRDGSPINEPWPLNGDGLEAVPGTDAPVFLKFRPYERIPFGPLGLEPPPDIDE